MSRETIELEIFGAMREVEFDARGIRDIAQCLRTIAATQIGTVPLDRAFGTSWNWIDKPEPMATAQYRADLIDAIEKFEPRVEVLSISFRKSSADAMNARLLPVVRFRLREGVEI